MDLDAVGGVVAGRGSSDSAVRHQMAFAWASEQAPCRADSSTFRRPVVAAAGVPHRLGKRTRTPRGSHLEWVLLDSFIRHLSVEDSSCTALTYGSTSAGDLLGVGFRAAAPPETSRLVFDWFPVGKKKKGYGFGFRRDGRKDSSLWSPDAAKAVAAHRDSILLRFLLPGKGGISEELFVYKSGPMALTSLGCCGHAFINCNAENNAGILRRVEDDEFAVAHLTVTPIQGGGKSVLWSSCPVTADLCYMLSKDGSWHTKCLQIHHGEGRGEDLVWWETDAVIAFGDFICLVDYLRGVLLCDVFSPNPELRYVPLPVTPYEGARHPELGDRGGVFVYRSVCVTQNGVRFIDAAAGNLWFSSAPSDITSWTLSSDNLTWVEDGRIALHRFYVLTRYLGLPQMQPRFPIVDINCPQIVYFALRGETCSGTLLVPVDMVSNMIGRPTAYALRSSLSSDEDDNFRTSCNMFYNEPFLACEFSNFMGPDVLPHDRNLMI